MAGAVSKLIVIVSFQYMAIVMCKILSKYSLGTLYTYHPLSASLLFFLSVLGIQFAQTSTTPGLKTQTRNNKLNRHGLYFFIACLLAMAANTIIYVNKELRGAPHTTSWHGTLGLITTVWFIPHTLFGSLLWYAPPSALRPCMKTLYAAHRSSGYLLFGFLSATHLLALWNGYVVPKQEQLLQYWLMASVVFAFIGTVASPAVQSPQKQKRT